MAKQQAEPQEQAQETEPTAALEAVTENLLHEAPAIAFTKLFGTKDGQVIEINVTARADTLAHALDELFNGAVHGKEKYHLSMLNPNVHSSPAKTSKEQAPSTSAPASAGSPASQVPAPAAKPANQTGASTPTIHAVKLEITPDAEDKVTLKWYAGGHKYPDIYTTRTTEKILELLRSTGEDWTITHLSKVGSYTVNHDIRYLNSEKTNSKGNPYKDIVEIRPA